MKRLVFLLLIVVIINSIVFAQNFLINFTASGISNTLDSIYVENLTQKVSMTLMSTDTLRLYGTSGIYPIHRYMNEIKIYPNPFEEKAKVQFYSDYSSKAVLSFYNSDGKIVLEKDINVMQGNNIIEISNFPRGFHLLILKLDKDVFTSGFVSINKNDDNPTVNILTNDNIRVSSTKNHKIIRQMPYNPGDRMIYIGYSGIYSEHKYDIPTSSKTVDFEFSVSSCGGTFTDSRDGNSYQSLRICKQCWMKENLKYLPSVSPSSSQSSIEKYYYVYGYQGTDINEAKQTENYNTYGVLYNWAAAVNGVFGSNSNPSNLRGVCPDGWHLPSYSEWNELLDNFGGAEIAGPKLKSQNKWLQPNNHTNQSGFSALPGGTKYYDGNFYLLTIGGDWWTSSEESDLLGYDLNMNYDSDIVNTGIFNKNIGASVRCIKD